MLTHYRNLIGVLALCLGLAACNSGGDQGGSFGVASPDGQIDVQFALTAAGQPSYLVRYKGQVIIDTSLMGFELKDEAPLAEGFAVADSRQSSHDETWEMPWGEQRQVRNHYNELLLHLVEKEGAKRQLDITFRVFDDGLGFRYGFPGRDSSQVTVIMDEHTAFNFTADHDCWWQPGDWDIYEHLYHKTKLSEINALDYRNHPNLAQTYIPENAVNTPVTLRSPDGKLHLSLHEAALLDYSDMTLKLNEAKTGFVSELVGGREGHKVKRQGSFHTPWRSIQISERAGQLIESRLILNLNEPPAYTADYVEPMKYMGIWWEYHLGKSTWAYEGGRHGATTENAKRFIDFASAKGIRGLLIEGWNTGWEKWLDGDRTGIFDFRTAYPDFNMEEVVAYAKARNVTLIMHHETSSAITTYEERMIPAFEYCQALGIHAVKTGYVGPIIPQGEYHHSQYMVQHYQRVLETAHQYQVAVNAHEPIKATGLRRTYPNFIAREGLRGQEFNAWSSEGGNPPSHLPTVAFTRMLAGPIDYTPGIFDIQFKKYSRNPEQQVRSTLAQQLALYVVIYSPIQMAADLVENYEGHPAFQFIQDVAVDWEQTKVLDGAVGEYVMIARQERGSDKWFLGAITDETGRELSAKLDFLPAGKTYVATVYADAADAHWKDNPTAYSINSYLVDSSTAMTLRLAAGGGAAISLLPASEADMAKYQKF